MPKPKLKGGRVKEMPYPRGGGGVASSAARRGAARCGAVR